MFHMAFGMSIDLNETDRFVSVRTLTLDQTSKRYVFSYFKALVQLAKKETVFFFHFNH